MLVCAVITVTILLYLFVNPVYFKLGQVFSPRKLPDLATARNYYSILSSFAGFGLGILGLIVGYLYYVHKQSTEASAADRERKRKRLDDLIAELRSFDDLIEELIHFRFHGEQELEKLRQNIERVFDGISLKLEASHLLLGLDKTDISAITRVWSFIEKNDNLMHKELSQISATEFLESRDEFRALIKQAMMKCFEKVA